MHPNDFTDGENNFTLENGDLPSADMDDIHTLIATRIENMVFADIKNLDLPFSVRDISIEIDSLDITVNLDLEELEEDEDHDA